MNPLATASTSFSKLPHDANRILFVKHLPFNFSSEEMYGLFGRYGSVREIRLGNTDATKGRAFVVYDDIFEAASALEHLNGYNVSGRYLTVLYHKPQRAPAPVAVAAPAEVSAAEASREKTAQGRAELEALKAKYGVTGSAPAAEQ